MSHRRGDHMGCMAHLLSVNPKVKIYAPKEGFGAYGGDLPSTFYRKDASLPPEQRYYDGAAARDDALRHGRAGRTSSLSTGPPRFAPGSATSRGDCTGEPTFAAP